MSRIELVDTESFSPELRALLGDPDDIVANGHLRVIARLPRVAETWLTFLGALKQDGTLPRRLIEIVRLRIAYHNQCAHCMAVRFEDTTTGELSESLVCSLNRPADADDLSAAERMAIKYADALATEHLAIGDEMFAELREHFTEDQVVELQINCATFLGFGRVSRGWKVVDGLPDGYDGEHHMELNDDGVVLHGGVH
jgi:alkylhydroperoxidase family enzyme